MVIDRAKEEIICVDYFNGKAHDLAIFKRTLRVHPSIQILADSGYRGMNKIHQNSQYPLKHKCDLKNLNAEQIDRQKAINREISSKRMKIQHIIRNIKKFNITALSYRYRRKRFGLRLNLICGIINYEHS